MNGAARSAIDDGPHMPPTLPTGCHQHIWIARVLHDVRHAGVVINGKDLVPRLSAVGGLVKSAVAAFLPQRPLRRNIYGIRIARVDDDLADVFRVLQPYVGPRLAAIGALVHAIAVAHAPLAVVL